MLDGIKIRNFKKFKILNLQNFNRINIITGNTNSGKSTVLEAIDLCSSSNFYLPLKRSLRFDNMEDNFADAVEEVIFNNDASIGSTFEISVCQIPVKKIIINILTISGIDLDEYATNRNYLEHGNEVIRKSIYYGASLDCKVLGESNIITGYSNKLLSLNDNKPFNLYNALFFQTSDINIIGGMFLFIVKNKKKYILLESFKSLDFDIKNIEYINEKFLVDVEKDKLVSLNTLGSITISIIYLLIHIIYSSGGILMIDGLDGILSYNKIDNLIIILNELSVSLKVQLFITCGQSCLINKLDNFTDISKFNLSNTP